MRRVVIAGVLASGLALSGWWMASAGAQSTMVAPYFREVNSAAILAALGGSIAEDDAHVSGDAGQQILCVRQDTQSDLAADGDYVPCSIDDAGNIRITGSVLAWAQDGSGNALTSSVAGSTRPLDVQIRDSSGNAIGASSACGDDSLVSNVAISTASSGNVELVAISGSTVVYVCGFNVTSDEDVDVQFVSGTGTACATGEGDETGVYELMAASGAGIRGVTVGFGGQTVFKGDAGDAVCIELSGAVQVDGILSYVQQ